MKILQAVGIFIKTNLYMLYVIFAFNENIYAEIERSIYRVKISEDQPYSAHRIYDENITLATDGKMNTCSLPPSNSKQEWLKIELDRIYTITHIILFFKRFLNDDRQKYLYSMKVQISNDTESFKYCSSISKVLKQPMDTYNFSCESSIPGQFISLFEVWSEPVCEIQVFADLTTVNLAFKRPHKYQTAFHFENIALAIDGDLTTCTTLSTAGMYTAWLLVELEDVYYVSHVNIIYQIIHDGISVFVSSSDENDEEFLCATTFSLPKDNSTETQFLKCSRPIEGRYVTIKKPRQSFDSHFVICELEVYTRDYPREISNKSSPSCLPEEYKCNEGGCIHRSWLCDGTNDCPHADDEASCKVDNNHFKCKRRNESIPLASRCDGEYQCSDYSDEDDCFDVNTMLLKATFEGEKDFYICSDNWNEFLSSEICKDHNRDYLTTNKIKNSTEINKFIKITKSLITVDGRTPYFLAFEKSTTCNSDMFVGVDCGKKEDLVETCGKRGIPDNKLGPYIIKGHDAELGAWPWYVQIIIETDAGKVRCGGSLIKERWILTAAHCFKKVKDAKKIKVKMGTIVNDDNFVNSIPVTHFIQHPNYHASPVNNDIAILRLESSQSYTKYIKPICLPDKSVDNPSFLSYQYCVVAGFGHISRNKTSANKLQQTRMNIIENEICADYLSTLYKKSKEKMNKRLYDLKEICAGIMPLQTGPNICMEDGGSALVCKSKGGKWIQFGIATGSYANTFNPCEYSLFLKVYPYLDFIHTVFAKDLRSSFDSLFKNYFEILPFLLLVKVLKHY